MAARPAAGGTECGIPPQSSAAFRPAGLTVLAACPSSQHPVAATRTSSSGAGGTRWTDQPDFAPERQPMPSEPRDRLVLVTYPTDEDYARINTEVLGDEATVAFLRRVPESDQAAMLARAEALLGWNPARELPAGALRQAPELKFIQLLSAGADSVDFSTIPDQISLAGNVGAYAKPMAEHVLAMTLALAKR